MTQSTQASELCGLDFYSPMGVVSGLGAASRGYLAAIRAAQIPFSPAPVHELFAHQRKAGPFPREARREHPIALVHVNADSLHRFRHFHGRRFARAAYKIALWAWEMPALRDEWFSEIAYVDEIWAPSTYCRRAFAALTAKPVTVMPHVVEVDSENPNNGAASTALFESDAFVFLYVFDASSIVQRKNPQAAVDAFAAAFADEPRARLVLKTMNAEKNPEFSAYLSAVAARDPRCVILRESMSRDDLAALMRRADCYVSPHRSEGFGLTVAEAMALGKPVIATDFGATTDFVTPSTGFPLRFRLKEVGETLGPYAAGAIWAQPDISHLAQLMREVFADPAQALARGRRARAFVAENFSALAVGETMRRRLQAIALDPRVALRRA